MPGKNRTLRRPPDQQPTEPELDELLNGRTERMRLIRYQLASPRLRFNGPPGDGIATKRSS
jgi:hypothetical protein